MLGFNNVPEYGSPSNGMRQLSPAPERTLRLDSAGWAKRPRRAVSGRGWMHGVYISLHKPYDCQRAGQGSYASALPSRPGVPARMQPRAQRSVPRGTSATAPWPRQLPYWQDAHRQVALMLA